MFSAKQLVTMVVLNFLYILVALMMLCKSVQSIDNNTNSAEPYKAGFGYELVQARLDSLQFRSVIDI